MPLKHNYLHQPYPSQRLCHFAQGGMVATSQPLAAQAGLDILKRGGNAIDAAVATAACLTVVEPTANGIGGDAFALIWHQGQLHGLNASGQAPRKISPETLTERGLQEIPKFGFIPVTVPGAVGGWAAAIKRFGQLSFEEVLAPAITYARQGYPLSPNLAAAWQRAYEIYQNLRGEEYAAWFKTFAPGGRPPKCGEIWRSPDHADTLEVIAQSDGQSFYRGELSEQIDRFSRMYEGFLRGEDLAQYQPQWVEPIGIRYRDVEVWEIPPNGQGIVALMALKIMAGFTAISPDDLTCHRQLEAIKLAFADGKAHVADPDFMTVTSQDFLRDEYAEARRQLITSQASLPPAGQPDRGGTVYLAAADGQGNMVSFIQSNYMGFGSGLVVPGTGIALQNRGHNFSLQPGHPNRLAPGKRSYHTIIPGFLTQKGEALGPFGVMGGFMQPQGHLQVVMNMVDYGLNPQAALDAPRWQWLEGKTVALEHNFPPDLARQLSQRGHDIKFLPDSSSFGRGQIILRNRETGVLVGGTEPRTDGTVVGY